MRYCERRDAVRGDSEGGGGERVRGAERRDTGAAAARGGGGLVPVLLPLLEVEERVLPAAWFRVGARGQAQVQAQWFWLGLGLERGEVLTVGHLKRRLVDGRTAPRPLPRTHKHGGARRDAARIVRERRCAHAVLGGYPATAALGLLAYHHGERRLVRVRVGVRVKVRVGVGARIGVEVRDRVRVRVRC